MRNVAQAFAIMIALIWMITEVRCPACVRRKLGTENSSATQIAIATTIAIPAIRFARNQISGFARVRRFRNP